MTPNVGYPVDFHQQAINNAVFQRLGSAPASPVAGQFYVNTGDGLLYKRNEANTAWEAVGGVAIKPDGSVAFTGNQSMGNNKLTLVGDAVNVADAVNKRILELSILSVKVVAPDGTDMDAVYNGVTVDGRVLSTGDYIYCGITANSSTGVFLVGVGAGLTAFHSFPSVFTVRFGTHAGSVYGYNAFTGAYVKQNANATTIGTILTSATAKTTPVDADTLPINDSAASNVLKKLTFANLRAWIGSAVKTLTNTTFDANGTGNSITNLETGDFAAGTIQTSISGSSTNSQIPTALAVENRINALTVGLWSDQGNYDASGGTFPTTGGSGSAGAIAKGDVFRVSVAGTLGGVAYSIGGSFRALIDEPGQTAGNWATITQDDNAGTSIVYANSTEAKAKTETGKATPPSALTDFVYSLAPTQFGNGALTQFDFTHAFTTVTGVKIKKVSDNQHWTFLVTETSGTNVRVNTGIVPTANEFEIVISGK